jgi:hypothetical protein
VIDAASDLGQREEGWTNERKIGLPDDVAFVDVYEAYTNELITGPEFGCIHFEPTEDEA